MAVAELLSGFLGGAATASKGMTAGGLEGLNPLAVFSPYNSQKSESSTRPKAYLNYLLFDEQFRYVTGNASPVNGGSGTSGVYTHILQFLNSPVVAPQNGYIYIFVSNESNIPVFFDNLTVTHTPGPVLEENSYYPFGLEMQGISSKALNGVPANRYKYNSKEEQRQEFSDGSGLELLDYGARMYSNQIGRWYVQDNYSETYLGLTPYNYGGNNPVNIMEIDGNLFIFANGFMLDQYLAGQRNPYLIQGKEDNIVSNFKYEGYAPDRKFYSDGPHNNGKKFENNYWEGIDVAYKNAYKDKNAFYTNGSFTPRATASARFSEGLTAGAELIGKLESGEIMLQEGETIKIIGHSQGAAYAAGIATALAKHSKYGSLIEFVDYLSPHQPGDINHPNGIKGRQFSTKSDKISSKGLLPWLFGGSDYEKISGTEWGKERDNYNGGRGGHSVGTWLNDLIDYWRSLGIKVTVQE